VDVVLAAQPGPDLAISLTGERRPGDHRADQLDQLVVSDCSGRPRPDADLPAGDQLKVAATVVHRGTRRAEDPAHPRQRRTQFGAHLRRFAGGISSPRLVHWHQPRQACILPR